MRRVVTISWHSPPILSVGTTFRSIYTDFDPAEPLLNILVANDDFPDIGLTGFDGVNLTEGETYFYVMTGYGNDDFGDYELDVTGSGEVFLLAIPEPSGLTLLALGSVGLLARRRRDRQPRR